MQTLIVVSKSTPIAVFHFIISNYVSCVKDPVQRIATTKTLAFMLFPGTKVPLGGGGGGAITCILEGQLSSGGLFLGAIVRGGGLSWGGNSPSEICPRGSIVRRELSGGHWSGGIVSWRRFSGEQLS